MISVSLGVLISVVPISAFAQQTVSLEQAIALAQANDPWLHGSKLQQSAIQNKAIAAGTLADPNVSINMAKVPTDTWNFGQEGKAQLTVGVSQMFARGDELSINKAKFLTDSTKYPLLREDRKAQLTVIVSQLWLDAFQAQKTIELINKDKVLFEQMVDIAKASYSSALGKTRQQDVIRSQLELIQLDDRLTEQQQILEVSIAQLNEWLHLYSQEDRDYAIDFDHQPLQFLVSNQLPNIQLTNSSLFKNWHFSRNELAQAISNHPSILAIDVKQDVATKEIELAEELYKPQWGVNASYALGNNAPTGMDKPDSFSVGVTFDLPLFTANKQDKLVAASVAEFEAVKTEKLLLMKKMMTEIEKNLNQLRRLSDRQEIYDQQLLSQTHDQAEASLTAYTNDDGDFAEVVRARIVELNTRIAAFQINVNALKAVARINYFFVQAERQLVKELGEK